MEACAVNRKANKIAVKAWNRWVCLTKYYFSICCYNQVSLYLREGVLKRFVLNVKKHVLKMLLLWYSIVINLQTSETILYKIMKTTRGKIYRYLLVFLFVLYWYCCAITIIRKHKFLRVCVLFWQGLVIANCHYKLFVRHNLLVSLDELFISEL